jgi:CheY-like chemotaxis protein
VTAQPSATPSFDDLLARGQEFLSQLTELRDRLAREQRERATERRALAEERDQLRSACQRLEVTHQTAMDELRRLTSAGEELRRLQEELEQAHATAAERQKADAEEMSRLQDELRRVTNQLNHKALEQNGLIQTYETEAKRLRDQLTALSADHEALQAYQLQWAIDREEYINANRPALVKQSQLEEELQKSRSELLEERAFHETIRAELEQQLSAKEAAFEEKVELMARLEETQLVMRKAEQAKVAALEEYERIRGMHAYVTEQGGKLADEWSARRRALAAENQRLRTAQEQASATLEVSQRQEKQWQAKAAQLQDELKRLSDTVGRVLLTDEQTHHLQSQLNAITGFADVLLDEAGNRTTAADRQEYLRHIKESGAHLADYVRKLTTAPHDGSVAAPATQSDGPVGPTPSQRTEPIVLVADTDPAVRERIEPFLRRAGYQVEFANGTEDAIEMAIRLQPLAIMIDTALPPDGAPELIDKLLRDPRTHDIPVLLTVRDEAEQLGLNIGRHDFLSKPIDRQQVLQMMVKYDLMADRRRANKMPATVLVVDDDSRNTRLVEAMLKPFKIEVLVASGGATGIKLALERKPDLVILDLMMPDVDGFNVVSALRKDSGTSQIPILIYTAKNVTSADRLRLQGNIQSIVRKGEFNQEQFLELVYKRGERRTRGTITERAA